MIRPLAAMLCGAALFAAQLPMIAAAHTAQPSATQPSATQPSGAQPSGAQPSAAQPSAAQQAQQNRMRSCNGAASTRSLKGDARQTFMSSCLAGKTDPNLMMKACNAQASQDKITGDTRRNYMSACLKAPG